MKKISFIICFLSVLWSSCDKDLGNYTYQDIHSVSISDIEKIYTRTQTDTLKISPKITHSIPENESNIAYLWLLRRPGVTKADTVGITKNISLLLNFPINNNYSLEFFVINTRLGIYDKAVSVIDLRSSLGEGLLVLSENASHHAILSYIYETAPNKVIEDVQKDINKTNEPIGLYPKQVHYVLPFSGLNFVSPAMVNVFCQDEKGGLQFSSNDLVKSASYTDIFYIRPNVIKPQGYTHTNYPNRVGTGPSNWSSYFTLSREFVNNNGQVHERYPFNQFIKLQPAYLSDDKGYIAADIILGVPGTDADAQVLVYDRKNRRFLQRSNIFPYHNLWPVFLARLSTDPATPAPFDAHNLPEGMELIFGDVGYNTGSTTTEREYYTIFQNTIASKFYFLKFRIQYLPSPHFRSRFVALAQYEIPFSFTSQTTFAQSPITQALYYSAANEIRFWNTNFALTSTSKSELATSIPGETITAMKVIPLFKTVLDIRTNRLTYTLVRNRLFVGTSGPAVDGKQGSVYVYTIDGNSSLTLETSYKNIAHKIVDFAWKY